MSLSFLGYDVFISYWDQYFVCVAVTLFTVIQIAMTQKFLPVATQTRTDEMIAVGFWMMVLLPFLMPLVLPFLIWDYLSDEGKLCDEWFKMQKTWFSNYIDTDYVAIFMPVLCVLTLFLL